jgi:GNAT superfamily N-acetyltransferase
VPAPPERRASAGWLESDDRVAQLLRAVVDGAPPPSDGATEVLPQPSGPVAGVLAFDGHHVVAADVDEGWVHEMLPAGDLSAPLHPRFLGALAERLGRSWDNLDAVLVGRGEVGDVELPLELAISTSDHPRVARSFEYRHDSTVYELPQREGVLIIGRGLSERWEAAFEVAPAARGRGLGRALVRSALRLVPLGEPVFVQVAPGNVSSLRAVLAAGGFAPIGAEVLYPGSVS